MLRLHNFPVQESNTSISPEDFGNTFAPGYLGNPKVVSDLVGQFAAEIHGWILRRADGTLSHEDALALTLERELEFSRIFSGQHPDYPPVIGWNSPDRGLAMRLRPDLSTYWIDHHDKHGDDAYRVLHAWLVWFVWDCMKRGESDSTGVIFEVLMGTGLKRVTKNLLGIDKRA